jgi:predicted acyl esterase
MTATTAFAAPPAPTAPADREIREYAVPMRDGTKLHTVVVAYRDGRAAPAVLVRTAFGAMGKAKLLLTRRLPPPNEADLPLVFVYQDVRGRFGSQGTFETTRALGTAAAATPGNATPRASRVPTDDTTDAWDTVAWIARTLPRASERVALLGNSLDGFYAGAALLDPHPAVRAAVLEQPLVDGWRGDDWFHYGAFRLNTFDYVALMSAGPEFGAPADRKLDDDYPEFLSAGSAAEFARSRKIANAPMWKAIAAHPTYDAYWQSRSLDRALRKVASNVPTLWVHSLWDQEDAYGAPHAYLAAAEHALAPQYFVAGPWTHRTARLEASGVGPLEFGEDTAATYRRDVLVPFLAEHLLNGAPAKLPAVRVYDAGARAWRSMTSLPKPRRAPPPDSLSPSSPNSTGMPVPNSRAGNASFAATAAFTPLYLGSNRALASSRPQETDASDAFTSDPKNPVPFAARPIEFLGDSWESWNSSDQSQFATRPDVLTYRSAPLDAALVVTGFPFLDLHATTTGSDADWIVKLIDVVPADPNVPGSREYALPIAMEIFRGRYREGLDAPRAIPSGTAQAYRFDLPLVSHTFARGHRIAVQIQSTWFPLYDRNPQSYVANIMEAKPADYAVAEHRVLRSADAASAIWLPK